MSSEQTWPEPAENQAAQGPWDTARQEAEEWNCDGVPAELPSWDDLPVPEEEPLVRFPGLRAPADAPIFF